MIESIAIINYLEEAYPENPLLPTDLVTRAKIRSVVDIIASGIQPLQNSGILSSVESVGFDNEEWARKWISAGFEALEKILVSTAGKYCFGDEITMADCVLVPQVLNARKYLVLYFYLL